MGRNEAAETLFRETVAEHPQLHEAAYSLGLLLVEQKKYQDAVRYLKKAAKGLPQRARVQYNLGLLLQQMGRINEAETVLLNALRIEPNSLDYLHAVADHYLRRRDFEKAKPIALQLAERHPDNPLGRQLLAVIKKMSGER
jgi:tetratricopeptide (TPR) repeat protein